MRRLNAKVVAADVREAASLTAVMFFIVIGGLAFSRLLLVTGFVDDLLAWINAMGFQPWMLMLCLVVLYLILGCLMDPISMMVMTVPVVHPLVVGLGFDPIWFAIIMVKLIELSVITPPVGLNLFVVVGASRGLVSTRDVYQGVSVFIVLEIIALALLLAFPQISLYLPNVMIR
jgi:TRAP-type C4-dicarboxylate transport system permease large subunit